MKNYITAALASASLFLGASVFAQTETQPSTVKDMPSQTEPGRAYDRARLPNPATGNAVDDSASGNIQTADELSEMNSKAVDPQQFILKAAEGDQVEIRSAQLAQEKSANPQIKALAQRLSQDHQANADKLAQLAQQKGVHLSDQLSAKAQRKVDTLSSLNGAAFDQRYVRDMVRDHKKDIAYYQKAAAENTDPDVKAFAQSTLPTLQEHLQMAERDSTMINEPAGARR